MALWMVRAGKQGEHERKFLDEERIYLTWSGLNRDLAEVASQEELRGVLKDYYPDSGERRAANHASQIWSFAHSIDAGDWIVLPSKLKPAIHVAEVKGRYVFEPNGLDPYIHFREVKWITEDVPRSNFGQDLLSSMGSLRTICRIQRHDAERRVHAMAERGWRSETRDGPTPANGDTDEASGPVDLEQLGLDQIAELIIRQFKGHGLEWLVESLLQAQGYATHRSPVGPDKGVDILAAPAPLGFGSPRLCVQVKSSESPVDLPTLNQLIGAMQNVQAEQGLLVSWGGFKRSIEKEVAAQFFRVRLWDRDDLIRELLSNYTNLPEDVRAELPLKRVWTVSAPAED